MSHHANGSTPSNAHDALAAEVGQIVVVFQGGGALGAYQAGVYQALHEAGIEPDWIIGTSIGAINAALITGNPPEKRIGALTAFWQKIATKTPWRGWLLDGKVSQSLSYLSTLMGGVPNFFEPNPLAFYGTNVSLGVERAGYYSTEPLRKTLTELVDFAQINSGKPRLTVGAANVRSSRMHYFDSRAETLDVRHVLASGALPPAFPAVRIDGELYWDGGIISNTPTEVVFDDNPRRNALIFAVHMWNPVGPEPDTIGDVLHRLKDIQYSSRVANNVVRQKQMHRLRHIIKELADLVPAEARASKAVQALTSYGCLTRMHVVQLLAPQLDQDNQTKDVDFSPAGITARWQAGYVHTKRALAMAPWRGSFDPLEGVILHSGFDDNARALTTEEFATPMIAAATAPLTVPRSG